MVMGPIAASDDDRVPVIVFTGRVGAGKSSVAPTALELCGWLQSGDEVRV